MGSTLCTACYRDIPAEGTACPACGAPRPAGQKEAPSGSPWEQRRRTGRIAAFGETLQQSLFEPTAFFRALAPGGGRDALSYAVTVNVITAFIAWLWRNALAGASPSGGGAQAFQWDVALFLLLVLPVLVVTATLLWSWVLHLSLRITGSATAAFSSTLQAVAYASSANSFSVFPFAGSLVGIPWGIALQIVGLRECHGISTGRAVFAWILPFLLFLSVFSAALYFALDAVIGIFPEFEGMIMV